MAYNRFLLVPASLGYWLAEGFTAVVATQLSQARWGTSAELLQID
jgi:hypothetical protein